MGFLSPAASSTTAISLPNYAISPMTGFVPTAPHPLRSLPPYFQPWDDLAACLPQLIASHTLRSRIAELPLLDDSRLSSMEEVRRAFVVLGFLVHGFAWCEGSADRAEKRIPPQLAEPYLGVCERLGLGERETLSYAGLCIWNWAVRRAKEGEGQVPRLQEMECLVSFTGTRDEEVFYLVPVLVEMEGGRVLEGLLRVVEEVARGDGNVRRAVRVLGDVREALVMMQAHMRKLHEECSAEVFWKQVRPFLAGGKDAGRWTYVRSDGKEVKRASIGGSAAQSSTVPALDTLLGVRHKSMERGPSVFEEMREYMPGPHRAFLEEIGKLPDLGAFVKSQGKQELTDAYNAVLAELSRWRSKHIGVVTTHIVSQARKVAKEKVATDEVKDGLSVKDESELQGTGGTALIPFLKSARRDTEDAMC